METIYELWDAPSRNLIATSKSEDDGEESIEGVALVRHEPDGSGNVIAADAALARLAQERHRQSIPVD